MKAAWSIGVDSSGVSFSSVCDTVSILLTFMVYLCVYCF